MKKKRVLNRVLCRIWDGRSMVAFFLVVWIVFILPLYMKNGFVMIGDAKYTCYLYGSCFSAIGSLVVLIAGCILKKINWKQEPSYTGIFVFFYSVVTVVSSFFSRFMNTALWGYEDWHLGVFFQLSLLFVFFLTSLWMGKSQVGLFMAAAAGFIVSILVVLNRCGEDPLGVFQGMDWFEWNRRNLLATIGNINWVSCYLSVSVPVLLYLAWRAKGKWRIPGMICAFVSVAALFLQGSEAGLVDIVFYFFVLLWMSLGDLYELYSFLDIAFLPFFFWSFFSIFQVDLISPNNNDIKGRYYSFIWLVPMSIILLVKLCIYLLAEKGKRNLLSEKKKVIVHGFMIFAVGFGMLVFLLCQISERFWRLLGQPGLLRITQDWGSNRGGLWKAALFCYSRQGVAEILFGVGPDCFAHAMEKMQMAITAEGYWTNAVYANAHNEFITMLINEGLIGLLCYAGIFVSFLVCMGRNAEKNKLCVLGIMVVGGYLVNNLFAFQQVLSTPYVFAIMGILCHEMTIQKYDTTPSIKNKKENKKVK